MMGKQVVPEKLNDFFLPVSARREKGVYFCRLAGCTPAVECFVTAY